MPPKRIPVAAVEAAQKTLESAPQCHPDDMTKVQAIRTLAPQIHMMQSKGYSLHAIAGLLTESGIGVTAVTLRSFLNRAKNTARRIGKSKKSRPSRTGAPTASATPATPSPSPKPTAEHSAPGRPAAAVGESADAASASPAPSVAASSAKDVRKAGEGDGPRRSAFLPKEDTRDI